MGVGALNNTAIQGRFFLSLQVADGSGWQASICMLFTSEQGTEFYKWLGQVPAMREFLKGRHSKGLRDNGISIENKKFESTIRFDLTALGRDKTGQSLVRIDDLGKRASTLWNKLLSLLILGGKTNLAYDGKFYFATNHEEGDSGVQSNLIDVDISALPAGVHGIVTKPSVQEMSLAISEGIAKIYGFLDDQGEPMNETITEFIVLSGSGLAPIVASALSTSKFESDGDNQLQNANYTVSGFQNVRLDTWTDQFVIFAKNSGGVSAMIKQEEKPIVLSMKGEGSEFAFDNDEIEVGTLALRNVGYGMWQLAIHATLI